jgi:flagellar biosynthesis protein FlhF
VSSDLAAEVAEMRRELEKMARAVALSTSIVAARSPVTPAVSELFSMLSAAEVDSDFAWSVIAAVEARWSGPGRIGAAVPGAAEMLQLLVEELQTRFEVAPGLAQSDQGPQVLALVGPPGAGKTTTLVKLAVTYGLTARRPTQLLSMDTYRIAAAEQLRTYATILGSGFQTLETTGALAQALEEHRNKGLILIDTPGHSPKDFELSEDLARFLSSHPQIDTHLVLSCATKPADLSRVVKRFERFRPTKLLFSKLDETDSYGPIVNEAVRTKLPISFLATGQQVPEDLEPATKSRIVDLLLNGRAKRDTAVVGRSAPDCPAILR